MNQNGRTTLMESAKLVSGPPNAQIKKFNAANYQSVTYADVARNPYTYKEQKLVFSEKVLQVVEGEQEINLRVATDGKFNDVVFVGYDPNY